MVEEYSEKEVADACRIYVSLSDSEKEISDLFKYWDYLFFTLASSREQSELAWSIIKHVSSGKLTDQQFADVATGPFEEMLVSLGRPDLKLFTKDDLRLVRQLSKYVWPNRMTADVWKWIKSI